MTKPEREELLPKKKKRRQKPHTHKIRTRVILVVAVRAITDEIILLFNIQSTNLDPFFRLHVTLPKEFACARAEQNLAFLNTR